MAPARLVEGVCGDEARGLLWIGVGVGARAWHAGTRCRRRRRPRRARVYERAHSRPAKVYVVAGNRRDRDAVAEEPVARDAGVVGRRLPGGGDLGPGRSRLDEFAGALGGVASCRRAARPCPPGSPSARARGRRRAPRRSRRRRSPPGPGRRRRRARCSSRPTLPVNGLARRLDAVHVEARHVAVEGRREVLPLTDQREPGPSRDSRRPRPC